MSNIKITQHNKTPCEKNQNNHNISFSQYLKLEHTGSLSSSKNTTLGPIRKEPGNQYKRRETHQNQEETRPGTDSNPHSRPHIKPAKRRRRIIRRRIRKPATWSPRHRKTPRRRRRRPRWKRLAAHSATGGGQCWIGVVKQQQTQ